MHASPWARRPAYGANTFQNKQVTSRYGYTDGTAQSSIALQHVAPQSSPNGRSNIAGSRTMSVRTKMQTQFHREENTSGVLPSSSELRAYSLMLRRYRTGMVPIQRSASSSQQAPEMATSSRYNDVTAWISRHAFIRVAPRHQKWVSHVEYHFPRWRKATRSRQMTSRRTDKKSIAAVMTNVAARQLWQTFYARFIEIVDRYEKEQESKNSVTQKRRKWQRRYRQRRFQWHECAAEKDVHTRRQQKTDRQCSAYTWFPHERHRYHHKCYIAARLPLQIAFLIWSTRCQPPPSHGHVEAREDVTLPMLMPHATR